MAKYLTIGLLILLSTGLWGQKSRTKLEKERKQILQQIDLTSKLLDQTKEDKKASLSNYKKLLRKVKYREELIANYNQEIRLSEKKIIRNEEKIDVLSVKLQDLKTDLSALLKNSYRSKLLNNPVFFLFSAESLNNLFLRWVYLKKILNLKKEQAQKIKKTNINLKKEKQALKINIEEKKELLAKLAEERESLEEESRAEKQLIAKLRNEESSIKRNLNDSRKKHETLNDEIEKLIKIEMEKAMIAERKRKANEAGKKPTVKSKSFAGNKGKLPWPVKAGVITSNFGIQPHATVSGISEEKKGIGISTEKGTPVYAIADGQVSASVYIPGKNYMVLVKHGEYFSVYSQIENVEVSKNQKIKAGTQIGTVAKDPATNSYELFFQIYKNKTRLNPSKWIKKRP